MAKPFTLGGGLDPRLSQLERTLEDKLDFRHPTDSTKDIRLALGDDEIEIIQDPFGTPTLIGVIPSGSGSSAWGSITGTLSAQTDLQAALDAKVPTSRTVSAGTGLTGGGDLTANRTLALADTAVTPGTYGGNGGVTTSFTVDAQGRITGAAQFLIEIDAAVVSGQFVTSQIANDAVTDAKLRNSAALSVIGRSANSTGDPGDIAAGTDGHVLRRSGTALGFGTLAAGAFAANTIARTALVNGSATSVVGRSANSAGAVADIAASADGQVLRRASGTLAWGALDLSSANARTGTLPVGNGGTGLTSIASGSYIRGNAFGGFEARTSVQVITDGAAASPTWSDLHTFTGGHYINGGARVKLADYTGGGTLTTGDYYAAVSGNVGVTLPASPAKGQTLVLREFGGVNCTVNRNGNNINFGAANFTLPANGTVRFIFDNDVAGGWVTFAA